MTARSDGLALNSIAHPRSETPAPPHDIDPASLETIGIELPAMIAWQGEIELFGANWSLDGGRTVEFRLIETEDHEKEINPFKTFQKRRGGKVGQIFGATIVDVSTQRTVYSDECMLAGWSDSDRGKTVRFWLDDEASLHPFAGFSKRTAKEPGSMFAAAFVVIDHSGGRAVDLHQEAKSILPASAQQQRSRATSIALMIGGELFLRWLLERAPESAALSEMGLIWTPARAKHWVYRKVGIESLSELNTNKFKWNKFEEQIRKPFSKWAGDA